MKPKKESKEATKKRLIKEMPEDFQYLHRIAKDRLNMDLWDWLDSYEELA